MRALRRAQGASSVNKRITWRSNLIAFALGTVPRRLMGRSSSYLRCAALGVKGRPSTIPVNNGCVGGDCVRRLRDPLVTGGCRGGVRAASPKAPSSSCATAHRAARDAPPLSHPSAQRPPPPEGRSPRAGARSVPAAPAQLSAVGGTPSRQQWRGGLSALSGIPPELEARWR